MAAAAETDSEHPLATATATATAIATAIVAGARAHAVVPPPAAGFDSITGKGIRATVEGHAVLAGTAGLLADAGIDPTVLAAHTAQLSAQGKTPIHVAVDGQAAAAAVLGWAGVEVIGRLLGFMTGPV